MALPFSVIVVVFLFYIESEGKKAGIELVENLRAEKDSRMVTVAVKNSGTPSEVLLITCGNTLCAGLDLGGENVYYFPHEALSYARLKEASKTKQSNG